MSQGIFARGFALPAAVEDLSQKRTLAMSFAGKAFSATVLQANFLSHRMAFGERAARGHSPRISMPLSTPPRVQSQQPLATPSSSDVVASAGAGSGGTSSSRTTSRRKRKFAQHVAPAAHDGVMATKVLGFAGSFSATKPGEARTKKARL